MHIVFYPTLFTLLVMAFVWLNGNFVEESLASVSLHDTGLLHAAGVYTTMRSYEGHVFRLAQHLQRLRRSCEILFIPRQYKDDLLTAAVSELLTRNNLADARLRLTVTRGAVQQDPLHGPRLSPTVFLTATALEPYPAEFYERGLTVAVVDDQKLNPYDIQAGHKTLNYFSRHHALRDATQRGAGEALWFNVHNYLQSGSISNVFLVKNDQILTPPTPTDLQDRTLADTIPYPKSATLPGITRQTVVDLAKQLNLPLTPAAITINQLLEADELFLTNSIMGLMPVCRVESRPIGNDRPGPITQRLTELYQDEIIRNIG
ncbi:MAG TPA: aminotransferase class IV [Tepidisphaeraceae bacterium]|nr:aminotransferase class IV [Tepidisphaeraceae bacterium]